MLNPPIATKPAAARPLTPPLTALFVLLGVLGLLGTIQAFSALAARGPYPAAVAPFDAHLSGTVGGRVLIDDPAGVGLSFGDGGLAVEVNDSAAPLRIAFDPGTPIVPGILFDLGAFPLTLELLFEPDEPGRTFISSAGELTLADGAVQIVAHLYDEVGGSQFLSAHITLPTP
jgi:hypothetical protein